MIEINYVPIYMKINHIFFVIKGQFPVTDYIPNTIILYFEVHCIYVLRIFYCITCLCLSLTPPVSGLRCIVFNKVLFCSDNVGLITSSNDEFDALLYLFIARKVPPSFFGEGGGGGEMG